MQYDDPVAVISTGKKISKIATCCLRVATIMLCINTIYERKSVPKSKKAILYPPQVK